MPDPVISVVVPLYNKEKEVLRSISSVLSQTFQDFELIVINDGSTDKGPEIVRAFEDQRIRIFDKPNQGVSAARNKGIAEAKTDLIAFLDADDEWAPDYLETILRLVSKFPEASVFATDYKFKQAGGYEHQSIVRGLPESFSEGILENYFTVATQSDPPLCSSTVAVRKEAIESIGGFPVGITSGEDLLTWARLAIRYKIAYTTQPKACFWPPLNTEDRPPGRAPTVPDIVGKGLRDLTDGAYMVRTPGLKSYIAHWHTMRAAIYIQRGDSKSARTELQMVLSLRGLSMKWLLFYILTLLPVRAGQLLFTIRQRLRA